MERIPASERTLEQLKALTCLREAEAASLRRRQVDGRTETTEARSQLVRLAARLIVEEALEGEADGRAGPGLLRARRRAGAGLAQRLTAGAAQDGGGRDCLQRAADRRPRRAVSLADPRHRGDVRRGGRPQPSEPHGGERDHGTAVG